MTTTRTNASARRFLLGAAAVIASLLIMSSTSLARAETLTRSLDVGMSGADVGSLQSFLALDATIYPQGLVTNYFGFLTKSAVSNFQSRNGIDPVGRVGPITRLAINAQMAGGAGGGADITVPILSAVNISTSANAATFTWSTNEPTRGTVYYSTSPLSEYEYPHSVTISGTPAMTDALLHTSQNVNITGLQRNTTYYYDVYVTDAAGNATMTWQSNFHTTN